MFQHCPSALYLIDHQQLARLLLLSMQMMIPKVYQEEPAIVMAHKYA